MTDKVNPNVFKLPNDIARPVDIGLLQRELGLIDEHLNQSAIKEPNQKVIVKTSPKLDELLKINNLDLSVKSQRVLLMIMLNDIKESAPVINISFGSEASDEVIQKIAAWFRQQVHPHCLIAVGLDPSIGIGAVVRTTNKVFDFSLKHQFQATRTLLEDRIKRLNVEVT